MIPKVNSDFTIFPANVTKYVKEIITIEHIKIYICLLSDSDYIRIKVCIYAPKKKMISYKLLDLNRKFNNSCGRYGSNPESFNYSMLGNDVDLDSTTNKYIFIREYLRLTHCHILYSNFEIHLV